MKSLAPVLLSTACGLLAACLVPPSMMQRASWSAPPEQWQAQGRYKQAPTGPVSPAPGAPTADVPPAHRSVATDPATEGLAPVTRTGVKPTTEEGALYGWDGGVVDGSPQGEVLSQVDPRGLETPGGRMHIIELYQQVLDERDALTEEVQLLRDTLQQTRAALDGETQRADVAEAQVASLQEAHRELMEDNQSIAARLVTAQIRRLESEKLLLETRIAVEQEKMMQAEQAATRLRGAAPKSTRGSSEEPH